LHQQTTTTMNNNKNLEVTFSEDQYWQLCTLLRRMRTNTELLKSRAESNHRFELVATYDYELEELQKFISTLDANFTAHLNSLKSN